MAQTGITAAQAPAIRLQAISKTYRVYHRPSDRLKQSLMRHRRQYFTEHQALKPVTLDIRQGETLGIVGVNGSGKSTLLQIICGTLQPSGGHFAAHGRISALLELGAGFNPDFTGRENIYLNGTILGLSTGEIDRRYDEIVAFSGLEPALLERPVKTYSSGMYVRLAFAVAIAVEPDILIVDEALAVGDEAFQRKCFARIRALQDKGATILFVSHSARTVVDLCSRAILLDKGELIMDTTPKQVMDQYHRLIFAPEARQAAIREEIRAAFHAPGEKPAMLAAPSASAAFDAPESMMRYPAEGAEILTPRLFDESGQPAQLLRQGERYTLRYRVRFDRDAAQLRFATLIKTKTGTELAGAACHAYVRQLSSVQAGEEVEASFTFENRLAEGSYFMNCGVTTSTPDGDAYLHRIIDALQFQVLPATALRHGDMQLSSLIDLDFRCEVARVG